MAQAIAEGAQEVTPLQPAAESKTEDTKEGEKDVVSTLKKSQDAAAEREAGEKVPCIPLGPLTFSHAAACYNSACPEIGP